MKTATKYYCRFCEDTKHVPESPESPPRQIKTGCEYCETLTPHHPVGQPEVRG
jgi:hypothetical protein